MSIKILLADDSITIQKVVGIIFGGEEYALTVVDNGKAAVEKARELNPDILLIDALMPGMSGYEVCEAVRATPALAGKPILLLTGSFEPFDEDKAKSCGADDFLAKPFESQQIVTKVKELIEQSSSRTEAPMAGPEAIVPPPIPAIEETINAPAAPEEAPAADDIWGAFTEPEATAGIAFEEPADNDMETEGDGTGTQWIPVEEETFEFEETAAVKPPDAADVESAFGDVEFEATPVESEAEETLFVDPEEEEITPVAPEREEVVIVEPTVQPVVAVAPTTSIEPVSEDQLRAAIAGASREVIERIVWEVVPDLAEVMIREAIEKIKRGA